MKPWDQAHPWLFEPTLLLKADRVRRNLSWIYCIWLINRYRKDALLEENMLMNLHKSKWTDGLEVMKFDKLDEENAETTKVFTPKSERFALLQWQIYYSVEHGSAC